MDVSPLTVSPPRRFAPCLDVLLPGRFSPRRFVPWTIRPLDDSPLDVSSPELSFLGVSPSRCEANSPGAKRPDRGRNVLAAKRRGGETSSSPQDSAFADIARVDKFHLLTYLLNINISISISIENLYSSEIHPVANNMREHREKLN